jgi:outer membrane murein-binding lipoprotein Lpp
MAGAPLTSLSASGLSTTGSAGSPRDTGAVVVGWFAKIVITAALLGSLAFDGISIGIARAHVNDIASDTADAAVVRYLQHESPAETLSAARAEAASEGATMSSKDLVIVRNGKQVTLTITVHYAPGTALLGHLPGTGQLGQTTSTVVRTVNL